MYLLLFRLPRTATVRPLHVLIALNIFVNMTSNDVIRWAEQTNDELILECRLAGQNCTWVKIRTERGLCHQLQPTEQQSLVTNYGHFYDFHFY